MALQHMHGTRQTGRHVGVLTVHQPAVIVHGTWRSLPAACRVPPACECMGRYGVPLRVLVCTQLGVRCVRGCSNVGIATHANITSDCLHCSRALAGMLQCEPVWLCEGMAGWCICLMADCMAVLPHTAHPQQLAGMYILHVWSLPCRS